MARVPPQPETQVQTQNLVASTAAKRPNPFDNETSREVKVPFGSATSAVEAKRVKTDPAEDTLAQAAVSSLTAPVPTSASAETMIPSNLSAPAVVCYLMRTFALPLTFSPACSAIFSIWTLVRVSFTSKQSE